MEQISLNILRVKTSNMLIRSKLHKTLLYTLYIYKYDVIGIWAKNKKNKVHRTTEAQLS